MVKTQDNLTRFEILALEAGPKLNERMVILVKGWEPHPSGEPERWTNLPDYSGDIFLAREVEKRIDQLAIFKGEIVDHVVEYGDTTSTAGHSLRESYVCNLMTVAFTPGPYEQTTMGENNWLRHDFRSDELWALIHATPLQRCQAALLTVSPQRSG